MNASARHRSSRAMPIDVHAERQDRRRPRRRDASSRRPTRHGVEIPHLCYKEGMRPDGNCRTCMVEIKGERVLAPSCCRYPDGRHGGHDRQRARADQPEDGARAAALRHAGERPTRSTPSSISGRAKLGVGKPRFARAAAAGAGPLAPGDGGQPRRLHPVHALRARLPRGAGQRRHRLRLPRRALEDRVRPRRSDGRVDLRRLRRVRAGVPDRRADAGARGRPRSSLDKTGGLGVPVLRRRLPAHLPRQGQQDPLRRRARTARRTRAGCASRAATASTTCSTSIA